MASEQIGETVTCDDCLEEFEVSGPQTNQSVKRDDEAASQEPSAAASLDLAGDSDIDLLTLDDHWPPPSQDRTTADPKESPAGEELSEDYEFTAICPLCSTRQSVTHVQVGKNIKCPDCFSAFEIRTPPKHARRKRTSSLTDDDGAEFKLSDPIERPTYESSQTSASGLATEPPAAGPTGTGGHPTRAISPVSDVMRRAEQEFEEAERAAPKLPERPLTSGILSFLIDTNTLPRLVVLAVALQIEAAAVDAAFAGMSSAGLGKVASALLFMFFFVFGLVCFVAASNSMLAITQEAAGGNNRVETWPELNVTEWFYDSLYVFAALFVALLPGVVLGQVFILFGWLAYGLGLTAACIFSILVLSPILLVASLETGFPFNFASMPVFRSLTLATRHWLRFFLISLGLAVAAVVVWQLRYFETLLLNLLVSLVVVAITMTYFRVLGRLVGVCQEASRQQPD